MIIGSEGALGVITEAWMRLQHLPRFRGGAVFGFPDLFAAAKAVRAVSQSGLYPSNLRVIDNQEAGINGVNNYEETLLIVAFEFGRSPHRGLDGASHRAHQGPWRATTPRRECRPEVADGVHPHALYAGTDGSAGGDQDTFESAVTWDKFEDFHGAVSAATAAALKEATGRAGTVSTRFTHVYPDGPAPYYTFYGYGTSGRLVEQWRHIKVRASDALLAAGGTITHHHAVGRDHMPWYRKQRPVLFGKALEAAKSVLDPAGILNPGVLQSP